MRGATRAVSGLGVDVVGALNLVGALVKYLGLAFVFPLLVAAGYGEAVWPFLVAGVLTAGFGVVLERGTAGKESVGAREGYLVVSVVWLLVAVFGAVPYVLAEPQLSRPVDALFESMSGFSTTGSSVVADIDALSRSMAMWRQFTPVDRRRRDHRDVPGRAAAAARRRSPGALQDGDARARDAAGDDDPRERAAASSRSTSRSRRWRSWCSRRWAGRASIRA